MWLYTGLCVSLCIWIVLGIYVFSGIKKTYDRGGVFTVVIHLCTTRMEEPYLERLYGEEYRRYKLGTPGYLGIPGK